MTLTKSDLQEIKKIVNPLAEDIKDINKRTKKIEKNVDLMARIFDKTDVQLAKRVKRIEQHLGFQADN